MGTFSIVHWIIFLGIVALYGLPIARILKRTGFSGWWTLLMFVPLANVVGLWLFANAPWKVEPATEGK